MRPTTPYNGFQVHRVVPVAVRRLIKMCGQCVLDQTRFRIPSALVLAGEIMATTIAKAMKRRPLNVYLDQSLYGHFLNQPNVDWRKNELAALLLEAQAKNTAQVWASPTHVLETLQTTDLQRRAKLASIMLELIEARRMWHGNELETLRHFGDFLKSCAPKFVRYPQFFKERMLTTRRIWLGALALVAATDKLKLDPL